jgi:hypothetical protein
MYTIGVKGVLGFGVSEKAFRIEISLFGDGNKKTSLKARF